MTRGGVNMKLWRQIGKICLNCRKLRIVLSIENSLVCSLKFESEISTKNGVQNGVRFEKMPLRVSERHFQWRWADYNPTVFIIT